MTCDRVVEVVGVLGGKIKEEPELGVFVTVQGH
jgi:hypothetical protein